MSNILTTKLGMAALVSFLPLAANASGPEIDRISYSQDGKAVIHGRDFGGPCKICEVLVQYSRSLSYSVPITAWTTSRIDIEIPDLNQEEKKLQLRVRTAQGESRKEPLTLKRQHSILKREKRSHALRVGDKGEDVFQIESYHPQCGKSANIFDHAELKMLKQRFADAQIIDTPIGGCRRCKSVTVRWYNEPTGSITYELTIIGRTVQGICKNQVRNSY